MVLAAGLVGLAGGCTLLLNKDVSQCENDGDCKVRGGPFANSRCGVGHVCVGYSDGGVIPEGCSNSVCTAALGEPATCNAGSCVKLASTDCIPAAGDANDDSAIPIGFFLPRTGSFGTALGRILQGTLTGVQGNATAPVADYNAQSKGLLGGPPPVILVACDEATKETTARSAQHLFQELGVHAFLGGYDDSRFEDVLAVSRPAGAIAMGTFATDPTLADQVADGLVWSARPNRKWHLNYFAAELQAVKTALTSHVPSFRVTLAADQNLATQHFATEAGKAVSAPDTFSLVSYPYSFEPGAAVNYDSIATEILNTNPTLVIAGSAIDFDLLIPAVEKAFATASVTPPYYLLWEKPATLVSVLKSSPALGRRILGVDLKKSSESEALRAAFNTLYKGANRQSDPFVGSEVIYDGFYQLMYALQQASVTNGVPIKQVTGAQFKDAMVALSPPGASASVGPEGLRDALNLIGSRNDVDLNGAASGLDFRVSNLTGNSPVVDGELYCVDQNFGADAGPQSAYRSAGVSFSAVTGAASGSVNVTDCGL